MTHRPFIPCLIGALTMMLFVIAWNWTGGYFLTTGFRQDNWSFRQSRPTQRIADTFTLTKLLLEKLSLPAEHNITLPNACQKKETLANSCNGTCLQMEIPKDVGKRVSQIVDHPELQMTPEYHQILHDMAKKVPGHYNIIFATAASSNHFRESQAMVKALHENIYPHLTNFTFVYYNLGLSDEERNRLVKRCKCHVVDFPFEKFPSFFQNLKCFTWKTVIIKAHITQANILIWADASVRFDKGPDAFNALIKRTLERGLQFGGPDSVDAAIRTMPSMYHFFGDEPCAYLGMGELYATFGLYARGPFVERLFLEPWVACAINRRCMCPEPYPERSTRKSQTMFKNWKAGKGPLVYGLVHRFDQAAQGLLVQKLYRNRFRDVLFKSKSFLSVQRYATIDNYF